MLKKPDENLAEHIYLASGVSQVKSTTMYGFLSLNNKTDFFSFRFILSFAYVYEMRNSSMQKDEFYH